MALHNSVFGDIHQTYLARSWSPMNKSYYATAQLSDVTDRNIILNLRTKLDALGYYDEHEIERVVQVTLDPKAKQSQLESAIIPVADRLLKRYSAAKRDHLEAIAAHDDEGAKASKDAMDALLLFRSDLTTYLRAYTFISQIVDYGNTDFEKRAIFFKFLVPLLKFGREREGVDLSEITLTHHSLRNRGKRTLPLSEKDAPKLPPLDQVGTGTLREREKAYLSEIIEQLNTLFGSDTTDGDQLSYANTLAEKTLESEILQKQAAGLTRDLPGWPKCLLRSLVGVDSTVVAMDGGTATGFTAVDEAPRPKASAAGRHDELLSTC